MPTDPMGAVAYAGRPPDGPPPAQDDPNATRAAGAPLSAPRRGLATSIDPGLTRPGAQWSTPTTCTTYSMVLKAGRYTLEAWGGLGGSWNPGSASAGGYSKAELTLDNETKIFAVAGGNGGYATSLGTAAGGCNGGGNGVSSLMIGNKYYGGGGGASHISAVEDSLNHRIIVAGGAGGTTVFNLITTKGGRGGGDNGESSEFGGTINGQGGSQIGPGNGCASGSGCAGSFGNGGNARDNGCGGGGGWFGGAGSDTSGAGGGGSGFIFVGYRGTGCSEVDNHPLIGIIAPLKKISSQVGQSVSGGKVTITLIGPLTTASASPSSSASPSASASPTVSASASPRPPTKISNYAFRFHLIFPHIIIGPIFC